MKNPKISITPNGLTTQDKEYIRSIKRTIDEKLHDLTLEYNKCVCNSCRVNIINQMEDIVNAELFYWIDTIQAPQNAGETMEMDAFDNSLNHIAELNKLIDLFNSLRKQLM